jgi:uncharacterized membrane protein required for colicin V production
VNIYDLVAVAVAAGFVIRGWLRGFVREVIELLVLVSGVVVVFRFSAPIGTVLSAMANIPYELARIVGGVVAFVVLVVGGAIVSRVIVGALKIVPGASVLNRFGGAAVGLAFAAVIIVLGTTMIGVAPLPTDGIEAVDREIGSSNIGAEIVTPNGRVQGFMGSLSGESMYGSILAIRQIAGDRLAAGTIPFPLPTVEQSELASDIEGAQAVFAGLNSYRVAVGQDPLTWSRDLEDVAEKRAKRTYVSGQLSLDDRLDADLAGASIPGTIHTDGIVIGASTDGVIEAFTTTSRYAEALADSEFRRAGVALVVGPYGLVSVFVVSG